ncbi:MAG: proteasome subunit beta [Nitrospiria bacterium]
MGVTPFDDPGSSFHRLLNLEHPNLFPSRLSQPEPHRSIKDLGDLVPQGTTVLALLYRDGVVIAGDRRATEGYSISERRIKKVHKTDETSAIAIAGAAGPCLELIRLFQVELEHYEKLEGMTLSMEGKANKLSQMVKANLPMAMQGLIVIPIFVGYDSAQKKGRIFKYDLAGGQYEEAEYYAIGSGGKDARATMKKIFKPDLTKQDAIRVALEAIYDAAEADAGTGGPDLVRNIYPNVKVISRQGVGDVNDPTVKSIYQDIIPQQGEG